MKLGKYFTLEELTATNTGLPNAPTTEVRVNLSELVKNILDPARTLFNAPISVTSGYRSLVVNKRVGGAAASQHCKGEAADLKCVDNAKLFRIIRDNFMFDQLIWEGGDGNQPDWVHVSFRAQGNRNEVLRMTKKNGKSTYIRI